MTPTDRPAHWHEPVSIPIPVLPERILVPFDGSLNAERALGWARLVSLGTDAEVIVLVGYTQPLTMRGRGAAYVEAIRDDHLTEATELAQEGVQALQAAGTTARGIVLKGEIARGIIETAAEEGCGLIVIGRQGLTAELGGVAGTRDRFLDLLQGGVCEKVTRHSDVPVLVVP